MRDRSDKIRKPSLRSAVLVLMPTVALSWVLSGPANAAPTAIGLGTAGAASVLAGAGVTNTGPSVLARDLDTFPAPAITGFPPGTVLGTMHAADAVAQNAQSDLTTAYNQAASAPSTNDVTGVDLSGMTLTEGVYTASSGMAINGPLALTLNGTPASVFIFQAGSTLITGSNSSVLLTGGVQACNVFWQVSSSATLGTNTDFVGTILAQTSITLNTGATVDGRALARTGSVTLDDNVFTNSACVANPPVVPPTTPPSTPPSTSPPTVAPPTAGDTPTPTPPSTSPPTVAPPTSADTPTPTPAVSSPPTTPTSGEDLTSGGTPASDTPARTDSPGMTGTALSAPRGGSGFTPFDSPGVPALSGPPRTGGAPSPIPSTDGPSGSTVVLVAAVGALAAAVALGAGRRSLRARR